MCLWRQRLACWRSVVYVDENNDLYLSRALVTTDGVWIGEYIDHSQVATTNNYAYKRIADFHITNHSTLDFLILFPLVFTW
jgi:hypothetical protein